MRSQKSPFKFETETLSAGCFAGRFFPASRFGASETTREFLDASCGIDEFLFAGEKWMASGANADLHIWARGTRVINGAASAYQRCFDVFWMDFCFHGLKK